MSVILLSEISKSNLESQKPSWSCWITSQSLFSSIHTIILIFSMVTKDQHPATQIKSRLSLLNIVTAVIKVIIIEIK